MQTHEFDAPKSLETPQKALNCHWKVDFPQNGKFMKILKITIRIRTESTYFYGFLRGFYGFLRVGNLRVDDFTGFIVPLRDSKGRFTVF